MIEQPSSSLMSSHPRFQNLVQRTRVFSVRFWMGHYGALSPKATILYASAPELLEGFETGRPPPAKVALMKKYIDSNGKQRCVGKTALKQSQKYPRQFGFKIAGNLRRYKELMRQNGPTVDDCVTVAGWDLATDIIQLDDDWDEAKLGECVSYMNTKMRQCTVDEVL